MKIKNKPGKILACALALALVLGETASLGRVFAAETDSPATGETTQTPGAEIPIFPELPEIPEVDGEEDQDDTTEPEQEIVPEVQAITEHAAAVSRSAGNVRIDLGALDTTGLLYDVSGSVITVTSAHAGPSDTVTIAGTGLSPYAIVVEAALNIRVERDIEGISGSAALTVPDGANVIGMASGLSISDGDIGIKALGDLTVSGIFGEISGTDTGISALGRVVVNAEVSEIRGGTNDISALSYAVSDYTNNGNLNPANCLPVGVKAEFVYSTLTSPSVSVDGNFRRIFASFGDNLDGITFIEGQKPVWYKVGALPAAVWDFDSDTVTANTTLSSVLPVVVLADRPTVTDKTATIKISALPSAAYAEYFWGNGMVGFWNKIQLNTLQTIRGLESNTEYRIPVRAVSANGRGPEIDVEFKTLTTSVARPGGGGGKSETKSMSLVKPEPKPVAETWFAPSAAKDLAANAVLRGENFVSTAGLGRYSVKKEALAEIKTAFYRHDTIDGNAVGVRVTVPAPSKLTADISVSAYVKGTEVESVKLTFNKWYKNQIRIVHFDQTAPWGTAVNVAAKVDFTVAEAANLYFYSYNRAQNSFAPLSGTNYTTDAAGYVYFTTSAAGDIIISQGPLEKK